MPLEASKTQLVAGLAPLAPATADYRRAAAPSPPPAEAQRVSPPSQRPVPAMAAPDRAAAPSPLPAEAQRVSPPSQRLVPAMAAPDRVAAPSPPPAEAQPALPMQSKTPDVAQAARSLESNSAVCHAARHGQRIAWLTALVAKWPTLTGKRQYRTKRPLKKPKMTTCPMLLKISQYDASCNNYSESHEPTRFNR